MSDTALKDAVIVLSVSEFCDREIAHAKELMDIQFAAIDKQTELAMERLNERLAEMNQLRAQINEERGSYLARERFDHEHAILTDRVSALELQIGKWSGSIWMLGGAVSAVVILVNIALKIWVK